VTKASFGKFQTVGQLARGGMAEVYLCRLEGIGGFSKEVVVKCIIPEWADDPNFVTMFLDEARVVATLDHPGIVQVFEVGEQDGIPYIAMEYVKGVTVAQVIRRAHRHGKVDYGHSARILCSVCDALDYAHNAPGPDGQPLGLVHRDVTPGNIVISREGVPKLLDFGVAKSNHRLAQTQAGMLKGKLRYMSPEQVSQGTVDQRADIFSMGVCLYEMTTNRHPYGNIDGNDVALLKAIVEGDPIRPSAVVPDYPRELERIVLDAIERDLERRIPSARELRDRLERFAATEPHRSTTRELVAWLRELFPDFGGPNRTGDFATLAAEARRPEPSAPPPSTHLTTHPGRSAAEAVSRPGLLASVVAVARGPGRATWALILAAALGFGAAGVGLWRLRRPAPVATGADRVQSDDERARVLLDEAETLGRGQRFAEALATVGRAAQLDVRRPELNIRLAHLRDVFTTAALVQEAAAHLRDGAWRAAIATAERALARNPDNREARQVIDLARAAGSEPRAQPRDPAPAPGTHPPAPHPRARPPAKKGR
jgi:serine/threonine protein kinase